MALWLSSSADVCCSTAAQRFGRRGSLFLGRGRNDLGAFLRLSRRNFGLHRSRGDRLTGFGEDADVLAQLAQREDDRLALLRFRRCAVGSRLYHRGDRLDLLLNLSGQILRLARALLRGLGQRADFVSHNGEATAVIAGARRFDGGIERQ